MNETLTVKSEKGPKSDVGHYCPGNGIVFRFKTIERAIAAIHPSDVGIWFAVRRTAEGWVRA